MNRNKLIHFNVPVALCEYVIANKLINPFRLYLYFKILGSKFRLDSIVIKDAMQRLEISSIKTVDANLKTLIALNWIGFSPNTQTFFVRGFDTLLNKTNASYFIGVTFYEADFRNFRGFLAGAIFGFLSVRQRWDEKNKNKGMVKEPKKGGSSQLTTPPYFYPVSICGISKILSISLSTAHHYKELAVTSKYIFARDNFILIGIDPMSIRRHLKSYPNLTGKLRVNENRVYEVGPLLVKSNMRFKGRKKTKHIMGDEKGELMK